MINLASIKEKINHSPIWKRKIHKCMFCNARPRRWVKWFINPLIFHHGKKSVIRRQTIMNVSHINRFYLGAHSTIEEYSIADNGVGNVIIGNHTRIGLRATIIGPVTIGNHVILAQNVVLSGLNHYYRDVDIPIHPYRRQFLDRCQFRDNSRCQDRKTCHHRRRQCSNQRYSGL